MSGELGKLPTRSIYSSCVHFQTGALDSYAYKSCIGLLELIAVVNCYCQTTSSVAVFYRHDQDYSLNSIDLGM